MGRRFAYSRVSTSDQDWAIQLDALAKAGVDDRDIFREKASGVRKDRTELRRLLDMVREGDEVVVFALDRLARSALHLLEIVDEIERKKAVLISCREQIDTRTPVGRFFVTVIGSVAALERDLILSRTKAGVRLARERGVRFGRPPKLSDALIRQILLADDDPHTTIAETCRLLGVSRSTYYAALKEGRRSEAVEAA
jgi:DNA invertase Pin-like site-specific DNA recombinase